MIQLQCGSCGKKLQAKEEHAGRSLKCPNCQSPVTVPHPTPDPPAANPAPPVSTASQAGSEAGAGQTVVVQVQQNSGDMIGPESKSVIVVWLLAAICPGIQYFYIGQTGKAILFTLVSIFIWVPLVMITCGIGLLGAVPYAMFLIADSVMVTRRMRKQAISPWRFF